MRYFDEEDARELNAEPWQIDLLRANPEYLGWGPHEDYMWNEGSGWNSRVILPDWVAFGPWGLNTLNECVNFYFEVNRDDAAPSPHVSLILWWLHPRKGCSRGIEITRIEREDLPAIQAFLAGGAKRNADRFARISLIGSSHADA